MLSNGFAGINLSPTPVPSADGSYNVKLSPAEWNIFQENQAKASSQSQDTPPGENEISVSIDDSESVCLCVCLCVCPLVSVCVYAANVRVGYELTQNIVKETKFLHVMVDKISKFVTIRNVICTLERVA